MTLRVRKPGFPLGHFVDALIYYDSADPAYDLVRFLPDGNTELIINLTEAPQQIHDNASLRPVQTCREVWVSGVRMRPITIPSGRGSRMLIVAFGKGRGHPFYPMPMSELSDVVVEADCIFRQAIADLRDQLLAARSIDAMFARVEAFLLRQAKAAGDGLPSDTATRCVEHAVTSIMRQPGHVGLRALSDEIGYSQKHLIDLFRKHVGVTPKQYSRILRFQAAIADIERIPAAAGAARPAAPGSAHPPAQWADIARRAGYYDQSHFIHEFSELSGFTPVEYVARKADMLNYVPVL